MLRRVPLALVVCIAALTLSAGASAATLPAGFDDTQVATVPQPTALAFTPDGRLLVTSKPGQLRVIHGGALLPDAGDRPVATGSARRVERGLLGVAVDPDFQTNQRVYLYYTFNKFGTCAWLRPPSGPVNRVSRFVLATTTRSTPRARPC